MAGRAQARRAVGLVAKGRIGGSLRGFYYVPGEAEPGQGRLADLGLEERRDPVTDSAGGLPCDRRQPGQEQGQGEHAGSGRQEPSLLPRMPDEQGRDPAHGEKEQTVVVNVGAQSERQNGRDQGSRAGSAEHSARLGGGAATELPSWRL